MPLGVEVGLGSGVFVFNGDPATPRKKGQSPEFSAHVCCGQTAGWIKMPLGTEVNLGPGDVVLDGVAAPVKSGTAPVFGACLLWSNRWMDEDTTWYGSRAHRRHIVLGGDPAPSAKGAQQPPLFGPCPLWPRSPISATAELLLMKLQTKN